MVGFPGFKEGERTRMVSLFLVYLMIERFCGLAKLGLSAMKEWED